MDYLTMTDGTLLFLKDWGQGPPVVFSHDWPLNADAWDAQMLGLFRHGYRVIAYDRRGYGRSSQTSDRADIETYADDLACVIRQLDLRDIILVGHGAGAAEIARFVGRYGTKRVSRIVLISPTLPGPSTPNQSSSSAEHLSSVQDDIAVCRADCMHRLANAFFNLDETAGPSSGLASFFLAAATTASITSVHAAIKEFWETDFSDDLRAFNVPTMFIHGTADRIVPVQSSTLVAVTMVRNAIKKLYPSESHGLCMLRPEDITADIYAFLAD